jgi:4-amino-4-deoxy-L-arabinose transferase-like glycosyltransferase
MHLAGTIARRGLREVPDWAWPLLLGAALLAPGLGEGFWEPAETRIVDAVLDGGAPGGPALTAWVIGAGFRLLGVTELGARLPLALCGLGSLLLLQRLAGRLVERRAGLVAALVLATTPAFLLQCRHLGGEAVYSLALLAAVGGTAAFLRGGSWPDIVVAVLGFVAGLLSRGLLAGIGVPLAILAVFALLRRPARLPRALLAALLAAALLLGLVTAAILCGLGPSARSWLPSGAPGALELAGPLREVLGGFFPWTGLLALALPALLAPDEEREGPAAALALAGVLVCYAGAALAPSWLGALRPASLAWLALAVGIAVDRAWAAPRPLPLAALCAAGLLLVIHVDLTAAPETLLQARLPLAGDHAALEAIGVELRLAGLALAGLCYLALAGPPAPIGVTSRRRLVGPVLRAAARLLDLGGRLLRTLVGAPPRSWLLLAAAALAFACWCAYRLLPELGHHLSDKALTQRYLGCREEGEPLHRFGAGALREPGQLLELLRSRGRVFVTLPVGELGRLEHAARARGVAYHVLDERSSRQLLLSNRLGGPACDEDRNPLRRALPSAAPRPGRRLEADFEGRVMLLGYELPRRLRRGSSFRITLYLRVLGQVPANYKVFVHIDGAGGRIHGDHDPVGGRYPTQLWRAGDFIVDTHEVKLPLLATGSGRHEVFAGFWRGEQRLRVTAGPQDGVNRVRLGTVQIW